MENKKKIIFLLAVLWVTVAVALVGFVSFINDKGKINQENSQSNYLTMKQAESGVTTFLNNSANIVKSSPIKIP